MGACVAARVEEEDSDIVQASDSLPADSPVLLMTKEEYKDTLQEGGMQGMEALQLNMEQWGQEQLLPIWQVWDNAIERLVWNWVIDPRMPNEWNQVMIDLIRQTENSWPIHMCGLSDGNYV